MPHTQNSKLRLCIFPAIADHQFEAPAVLQGDLLPELASRPVDREFLPPDHHPETRKQRGATDMQNRPLGSHTALARLGYCKLALIPAGQIRKINICDDRLRVVLAWRCQITLGHADL